MVARKLLRAFGAELRACRKAKELTQEELAARAGLHVNFIGLLERGQRSPTLMALAKLTEPLGLKISTLIAQMEKRL